MRTREPIRLPTDAAEIVQGATVRAVMRSTVVPRATVERPVATLETAEVDRTLSEVLVERSTVGGGADEVQATVGTMLVEGTTGLTHVVLQFRMTAFLVIPGEPMDATELGRTTTTVWLGLTREPVVETRETAALVAGELRRGLRIMRIFTLAIVVFTATLAATISTNQ